jgi:hypothetical protein
MTTIGMIDDPAAVVEGRLDRTSSSSFIPVSVPVEKTITTTLLGSGIISQIIIALLFTYFVLSGSGLVGLLSCRFQQLVLKNVYFKHIILFITIFVTTFVLGWYTETAIIQGKVQYNRIVGENFENSSKTRPSAGRILLTYLFYTLIIYSIFLATTKCEIEYLLVFFILILIHFVILLMDLYSPDNKTDTLNAHDSPVMYLAFFVLMIGTGMYIFRQMEEHSGEWSTLKFIFGEPTCVEVK